MSIQEMLLRENRKIDAENAIRILNGSEFNFLKSVKLCEGAIVKSYEWKSGKRVKFVRAVQLIKFQHQIINGIEEWHVYSGGDYFDVAVHPDDLVIK